MPQPIPQPNEDPARSEAADRLLDELKWFQDNDQLRYKSDEDERRRKERALRDLPPIDFDDDDNEGDDDEGDHGSCRCRLDR